MSQSSFKDLRVWQEAMALTVEIYKCTGDFPKHEVYGLTQQIRRAAVSVPSNIAEGKGHYSDKEFVRFLFSCTRLATRGANAAFDRRTVTILVGARCSTPYWNGGRSRPCPERVNRFAARKKSREVEQLTLRTT